MPGPIVTPLQLMRRNHGTWRGWVRHLLALAELSIGRLRPFQSGDAARAARLVFVCLGNINRSAFACALARSLDVPAVSVGLSTTTGATATEQARHAAALRGLSLDAHRATDLADHRPEPGDVYLVMEVRHARHLVSRGVPAASIGFLGLWGNPARVHLHDPHTLSSEYFSTCFALIEGAVRTLVAARHGERSP